MEGRSMKRSINYEFPPNGVEYGKRNPYEFGIGKRSPYEFGIGKRSPYEFGIGKRGPFGFKRNSDFDWAQYSKRKPYNFGVQTKRRWNGLDGNEPVIMADTEIHSPERFWSDFR